MSLDATRPPSGRLCSPALETLDRELEVARRGLLDIRDCLWNSDYISNTHAIALDALVEIDRLEKEGA